MRPTPILSLLSVVALYRASLQVAASPCWPRVVPDVISASLSLDACAPLPVASAVHMPVTSRASSAFPEVQGRVGSPPYSVQRLPHGGVFREGYRQFLVVQASRFACHPGRSHRCGISCAALVLTLGGGLPSSLFRFAKWGHSSSIATSTCSLFPQGSRGVYSEQNMSRYLPIHRIC